METRFLVRASRSLRTSCLGQLSRTRHSSSQSKPSQQANPIGDYYASILEFSSPAIISKPPTTATDSSAPPISSTLSEPDPGPSILFSSRLSSPLERRSEIQRNSTLVAGIWVPPRPDEPDNCCMSGCVNCVWDRYGEELEEWAAKRQEADAALKKERGFDERRKRRQPAISGTLFAEGVGIVSATSMDDDGGGSETNWIPETDSSFTNDELFKDVPVGIREFMKQEKRLKERHAREGTSGG